MPLVVRPLIEPMLAKLERVLPAGDFIYEPKWGARAKRSTSGAATTRSMAPDWVPLAPTRVCEVTYDTIDEHRLRYPARFVRWRPDRDPCSCGFDQLGASVGDVSAFLEQSGAA